MRCILHIGTEKTGTTSFQRYFSQNRASLSEQGFLYPKSIGHETHRAISVYALPVDAKDDAVRSLGFTSQQQMDQHHNAIASRFAEELAAHPQAHTCIISSEHLHSRLKTVDQIARLHDLLKQHFSEVLVYVHLRPQIDMLISLASTQSRVGGSVNRSFLSRAKSTNLYFNYLDLVSLWSQVFGADRIICVPFKTQPDFTSRLVADLAIDTSGFAPLERVNEAVDVRVMAMVNALVASGTRRRLPLDIMDRMPCEMPLKPSRETARSIQQHFLASNIALVESRDDLKPGDLQPNYDRYPEVGNMDMLEAPCPFAKSLADLVECYESRK